MSFRSVRFFLLGYYGFGNWGDELSLLASIETLLKISEKTGVPFSIEVLYASPRPLVTFPGEVRIVERKRWREVFKALRRGDFVMVAGGSLLQDKTSFRSLVYYLFLLRMALCWHKKIIFYGCGLGPLRLALSRIMVNSCLRKVSLFIARDAGTFRYLASLKSLENMVVLGGDPILCWSNRLPEQTHSGERIAFFLRPEGLDVEGMALEMRSFIERSGEEVEIVAFHEERDGHFLSEFAKKAGCSYRFFSTPQEIWDYFSSLKMLFSMRLHPLILATMSGVPWFAFNVDPKIEAFSVSQGLETLLSLKDFKADRLSECLQQTSSLRNKIVLIQRSLSQDYIKTERALFDYLVREIEERRGR
ncbi:MAG: polysaccharide pyruvyl transferase CsaB [Candidatus Atribacteria bacterium]|nr:polysaccharide pyruvyl transferase CsaB [Candidatus Atribacteria bacterium]MCD6350118.1 polysaccharide pyruvyl transferase CsaB [Candidatus Atribacteria bacterium]